MIYEENDLIEGARALYQYLKENPAGDTLENLCVVVGYEYGESSNYVLEMLYLTAHKLSQSRNLIIGYSASEEKWMIAPTQEIASEMLKYYEDVYQRRKRTFDVVKMAYIGQTFKSSHRERVDDKGDGGSEQE